MKNEEILMSEDEFQAMQNYKARHGKTWKDRLKQAWLNDWREQWGTLRSIRNNPAYDPQHKGLAGIIETFEKQAKQRAT